jgi:hypothetical protein
MAKYHVEVISRVVLDLTVEATSKREVEEIIKHQDLSDDNILSIDIRHYDRPIYQEGEIKLIK